MNCDHESERKIENHWEGGMSVEGIEATVYELHWCPVCGALKVDDAAWTQPTGYMHPATQEGVFCHGQAHQKILP